MKQFVMSLGRSLLFSSVLSLPCLAAVIGPGGSAFIGGTTLAARPELAGLVLQDTIVNWVDSPASTFGTVQTRVVREFSTGTLDFYLRIFNNPQSANFVSVGRFEDYTGFSTDADFRLDGLGDVGPFQVKRVGVGGSSVNFVFGSPTAATGVAPGQSSLFLLIKTTATDYTTSRGDLVIGPDLPSGDLSNLFTVYAPASVPEPATYGMIAAGLAVLGMARRRHCLCVLGDTDRWDCGSAPPRRQTDRVRRSCN